MLTRALSSSPILSFIPDNFSIIVYALRGGKRRRERPLQIISAALSVYVQYFAGKIQAGAFFALHIRPHFRKAYSSFRNLRVVEAGSPGDFQREVFYSLCDCDRVLVSGAFYNRTPQCVGQYSAQYFAGGNSFVCGALAEYGNKFFGLAIGHKIERQSYVLFDFIAHECGNPEHGVARNSVVGKNYVAFFASDLFIIAVCGDDRADALTLKRFYILGFGFQLNQRRKQVCRGMPEFSRQ